MLNLEPKYISMIMIFTRKEAKRHILKNKFVYIKMIIKVILMIMIRCQELKQPIPSFKELFFVI